MDLGIFYPSPLFISLDKNHIIQCGTPVLDYGYNIKEEVDLASFNRIEKEIKGILDKN